MATPTFLEHYASARLHLLTSCWAYSCLNLHSKPTKTRKAEGRGLTPRQYSRQHNRQYKQQQQQQQSTNKANQPPDGHTWLVSQGSNNAQHAEKQAEIRMA
jgi:hypothetical protein